MLQLKRVELQGFKSFCERTELRFNGAGIAAIVGPNGCGKSNISDAISWVLGEQSAKSLRGARMEDVIFAGTRDRKPLGMAYVTMTLVDPDVQKDATAHKPHPVEEGHAPKKAEVTITRRLYRSGESEYLIDGRTARLRDIQDLFMGTGLGPESYAIIEQGRIGQILSSKPQDRRAVIEEAAGITRFTTKKRLAEAKLEGAKQNLARVYDILPQPDGTVLVALGDVAGKASPAALLMALLLAILRTLVDEGLPLTALVQRLNIQVSRHAPASRFITLFLASFHPGTGRLEFVNAGQTPPLLRRQNGSIERLMQGGIALGMFEGSTYQAGEVQMHPGDALLMYSDGLTEAESPDGQPFDEAGLERTLALFAGAYQKTAAAELGKAVFDAVERHRRDQRLQDDLTVLVLSRLAQA